MAIAGNSVYWVNYPRVVWEVRKDNLVTPDTLKLGIWQTKSNNGKPQRPIGLQFLFRE